MNPGMMNPGNYNQYKMYMKQIGNITELDGMNINDNSYMNQGQQSSQPKRDLFGTSGNANMMARNQPLRPLRGSGDRAVPGGRGRVHLHLSVAHRHADL